MGPPQPELVACEQTPLGTICLWQRPLVSDPRTQVTELTLDHEFLMSSCSTSSERALALHALEMHQGRELCVLVAGLGLGYTAREVLASGRVAHAEVIEFLRPLIDWLDRGLVPLAGELRADPRFAVSEGDIYARLEGPPARRYDLVLIDVDHSPDAHLGAAHGSFYTEDGLRRAKQHLASEGVLGVWSYAGSHAFEAALRSVFREVRVEAVRFENPVLEEEETNWLFFARG